VRILDRLPFDEQQSLIAREGAVAVNPFQFVAWASLSPKGIRELGPRTPRFPVFIDTGHNHTFTIREEHLRFTGLTAIPRRSQSRITGQPLPTLAANVWLYHNLRRRREPSDRPPVVLVLEEGIAVYPAGVPNPARMPILGLRALARNNLTLVADGRRGLVTLETSRWW
jgi:hypothetical protein